MHDQWNAEQARERGDNWFWAGFRTRTISDLANHAYDNKDFTGLPYLGDALEEAGCTDQGILEHLREEPYYVYTGDGNQELHEPTHSRGCWVLDLILGKE